MRHWIGLVVALYPRSWRDEFGSEFRALLDDVKPSWRVFANVLRGAIEMQITNGTSWLKIVGATAAVGAIVALGLSFRVAPQYVSTAVISVRPQPDPVRGAPAETLRQQAAEQVAQMEMSILSRSSLASIIRDPRLHLYEVEKQARALEDVIEGMRRDIRIQRHPATSDSLAPIVFDISFSYPNQVKVQATVQALAAKFTEMNRDFNRVREAYYRDFWGDISAHDHSAPAPPPPPGTILTVIGAASAPVEASGHYRILFLAWGLGVGTFLGLLTTLAMQWPRNFRKLTGFAVAGCVLAGAISFLIPHQYVSTALMNIAPAMLTEDPLAQVPAATTATEYLREVGPKFLSIENLSKIIQDPRLNLYSQERETRTVEEVARDMFAKNLRIEAVDGTSSAFRIYFTYPDRFKAQMAVNAMLSRMHELYQTDLRARVPPTNFKANTIYERKGGEVLNVLDNANLPMTPVSPNRLVILAMGLVGGLLLGAVRLRFRRPGMPASLPVSETRSGDQADDQQGPTQMRDLLGSSF